jgi:hypothetical protein
LLDFDGTIVQRAAESRASTKQNAAAMWRTTAPMLAFLWSRLR